MKDLFRSRVDKLGQLQSLVICHLCINQQPTNNDRPINHPLKSLSRGFIAPCIHERACLIERFSFANSIKSLSSLASYSAVGRLPLRAMSCSISPSRRERSRSNLALAAFPAASSTVSESKYVTRASKPSPPSGFSRPKPSPLSSISACSVASLPARV